MTAAAAHHKQQGSAFGIAFAKDRCEVARHFGAAQNACGFEVRREPVAAHGRQSSGRVALIGPHEHGRQRIAAARAAHFF